MFFSLFSHSLSTTAMYSSGGEYLLANTLSFMLLEDGCFFLCFPIKYLPQQCNPQGVSVFVS